MATKKIAATAIGARSGMFDFGKACGASIVQPNVAGLSSPGPAIPILPKNGEPAPVVPGVDDCVASETMHDKAGTATHLVVIVEDIPPRGP
jgi:hypothetical protein